MTDVYQKMDEDHDLTKKEQNDINRFKNDYTTKKNPLGKAGIWSRAFFTWITPMFAIASKTIFQQDYHYKLRNIDSGKSSCERLKKTWNKRYPTGTQPPGSITNGLGLVGVVFRTYTWYFLIYTLLSSMFSAVEFMNAKIMNMALVQLEEQGTDADFMTKLSGAGKLVGALVLSELFLTILKTQNSFIIQLLAQRIRHGINGLIFDKIMKKSLQRDTTFSLGEITNITQVDTSRIADMGNFVNRIIIAPMEILVGLIWLYFLVGKALFPGLLIMVITLFMNIFISKKYKKFRTKFMNAKDKRGKLITEVFSNIRFIKMTGLENYFLEKIAEAKGTEIHWIDRQLNRAVWSISLNNAAPLLFLAAIFGYYMFYIGNLDVATIFTVMQVYNIFRQNFRALPYLLIWFMDLSVSGQRIVFFLLSEEIDDSYIKTIKPADDLGEDAIVIKEGNFYWEDKDLKRMYKEEKDRIADVGSKKNKKGEKIDDNISQISRDRTTLRTRLSVLSSKTVETIKTISSGGKGSVMSRSDFGNQTDYDTVTNLSAHTGGDSLRKSLMSGRTENLEELYSGLNLNLKDINLNVKKGQCVALIGKVGSGKSSVLSCLSGELYHKLGTKIKIVGDTAYVSQKAWITSKTIKDNILFGNEYDEKRYNDSIKFASMLDDLKILSKGDQTLLGDKGINLSGGQKIRLSIARAMYANKDIYLFDDPISALDIHVGKTVMEEGIIGYLRGKTRVVATHAIAYLKYFDYIYVMDDGEIIEEGSYEDIVNTDIFKDIQRTIKEEEDERKEKEKRETEESQEKSAFDIDLEKQLSESLDKSGIKLSRKNSKTEDGNDTLKIERKLSKKEDDKKKMEKSLAGIEDIEQKKLIEDIIQAEDRAKGSMSWSIVAKWIKLGGGFPRIFFLFIVMCVWCMTKAGIPWFLQWWSMNHTNTHKSQHETAETFLGLYVSMNLLQIACDLIRTKIIFNGNLEMSKEVNFLMSYRLIHASISKYFDRVPMGRILNRFMKDIQIVDMRLAWSTSFLVFIIFNCIVVFGVAGMTSSPVVFIFVMFYIVLSFKIQRYYMNLLRELTRLKSIASTPVIQTFKESLDGVSTIRTFNKYDNIFNGYLTAVDNFQQNYISYTAAQKWFQIRVTMMSLMVVIPCIVISLFFVKTSVGIFALMLNFLLQITFSINQLLDTVSNHENRLISFERCCYFMNVKPEEGYRGLDILEKALRTGKNVRINTAELAWPKTGNLRIKNLYIRYRKDLPWVLKNLNLTIPTGTKVGIVGRTGAGKTTLISSIYRTFDDYNGQILIDGKEIREVDLKILRYTMTIIPQDPYLFEDSLRNNLDPMEQFSDEKIENILHDVGLWPKFSKLEGITTKIEKGGANLSQGEKQLVCLARALLFENKLVLMDEATANIDTQTEAQIQKLIKERFEGSTILMIAHRLNTILHCDKVLVLDQGEVLEFDDLKNLRNNPNSHFGRMLMQSDKIHENLK